MDRENNCCCGQLGEKTTERAEDERRKLINRLNRIEGQIRGIRGMIERDAYCADVLTQSAAAAAAINAFNREVLSRHISTCVVRDIRDGDEQSVEELVHLVQKLMK
ncbi:MAG: metal-sensing transcriptional repressor [Ruminococcaceae bacterium]|nr:metal-sensing transcriptional repressor [Oscillospiraceae bacterium]